MSVAPSLLALAETINAERTAASSRCPVAKLLYSMEPATAEELTALMLRDKREMPNTIIHETLNRAGYTIDLSPIESHRRALKGGMGCKCRS